jgi:hypothetical protein
MPPTTPVATSEPRRAPVSRLFPNLINEVPLPVENPQTAEDAAQNLRHTLAVFDHQAGGGPIDPDAFAVKATRNVYGPTAKTGLTWRELQLIEEALHRLEGLDK